MIIKLEKYNEIRDYYRNRTTGLQDMYAIGTEAGGYV